MVMALLAMAFTPGACAPAGDEPGAVASTPEAPPVGVVDSIFPIEEEIRRFRVGLPEVTGFAGGAPSRDALVDRFVEVVESGDLNGLAPLLLTRSEFGYLYYPHTMYTAKPYELSPALLWFQMENLTSRSLTRLSRRLAGNPLHASGYTCEEPPAAEGANRVWNECRVRLSPPGEDPYEIRLFGSIVERDGIFKFVSYSSEL
jgi:hypothetical protein